MGPASISLCSDLTRVKLSDERGRERIVNLNLNVKYFFSKSTGKFKVMERKMFNTQKKLTILANFWHFLQNLEGGNETK
jgi:hypothetical protein